MSDLDPALIFDREASAIAEAMADGDGFWRACSGCQESNEGHVSCRDYPYDRRFRCQPGAGCRECGGIGVLWDATDYAAVAASMLKDDFWQDDDASSGERPETLPLPAPDNAGATPPASSAPQGRPVEKSARGHILPETPTP